MSTLDQLTSDLTTAMKARDTERTGILRQIIGAVRFEAKHLWLQPQVRGRGWGGLLLAELEKRARDFGAAELVLDTNASLEAAGRLYQRAGYADVPPYNDNPNATNWYRKVLL